MRTPGLGLDRGLGLRASGFRLSGCRVPGFGL